MAKRKPAKRTPLRREPPKRRRPKAGPAAPRRAGAGGADTLHDRTWTALPGLPASTQKHAFLLVLSGPQFGDVFPLAAGRENVVGRREDCDVRLRDDGVSRRHATIAVVGEGAVLRDLRSANGTWIEGRRTREARLEDGARVHLGSHTVLKFVWADDLEARYQVKLAEGALQDPLTGLYNRRHLEERLGSELAACQRHGHPLSLLMCDVDHFKRINDEHGHLAGDETLKMVAIVLRGAVRQEDVLARYGGEEFVVIARETDLEGGQTLAERIRRAVERSRCSWQGTDLGVTISVGVGVSSGAPDPVPGRVERALVEVADRALYVAKQEGRNRVVALAVPAPAERKASP
jgi:two-component system cell cycle response regulator